jgi:hypothetical protein
MKRHAGGRSSTTEIPQIADGICCSAEDFSSVPGADMGSAEIEYRVQWSKMALAPSSTRTARCWMTTWVIILTLAAGPRVRDLSKPRPQELWGLRGGQTPASARPAWRSASVPSGPLSKLPANDAVAGQCLFENFRAWCRRHRRVQWR